MTRGSASGVRAALSEHAMGRGKRYEGALKARVIAFARGRRAEGASWARIAGELGLRFETLRRWCVVEAATSRAMRTVEVVPERSSGLVVVTASGVRVEGLTLEETATLLRALG